MECPAECAGPVLAHLSLLRPEYSQHPGSTPSTTGGGLGPSKEGVVVLLLAAWTKAFLNRLGALSEGPGGQKPSPAGLLVRPWGHLEASWS